MVRRGILAGDRAFTGPYGLQLGIEAACNYSCVFCGEFSPLRPWERRTPPHGGHMPDAVFYRLVESAARLDVEQISIVGAGEPFLHPNALDFFARVKAAGIRLMVTTNGSALTEGRADRLLATGLDILNVSFSAGTRETYGVVHGERHARQFEIVLERLRHVAAAKRLRDSSSPRLVIRCTVIKDNIAELADWVDVAIECGADELVLQSFVPPGFGQHLVPSPEEKAAAARRLRSCIARMDAAGVVSNFSYMMPLFEGAGDQPSSFDGYPVGSDFYRLHPCLVGWTYAVIFEWGSVMPCCYCGTPIGNIYDQPLEEIWNGEAYNAFRRRTRSLADHGQEEPGCPCFHGCGSVKDNIRTIKRLGLERELAPGNRGGVPS
jgi:MoaA/NifB/PqqE/SkfB family radical SAM enzyme